MARRTLSEMISEHRHSTGLNRNAYAKAVGLSSSQVERIEKGNFRSLRPETVLKLSVYTGYTPSELWAAIRRGDGERNGIFP